MTNVTEVLDQLDKAVLEFIRARASTVDYGSLPSYKIIQAAQMRALVEEAAQTGVSLEYLLWDEDAPPPVSVSRTFERQYTILMGRMEGYLDSRTWETEAAHFMALEPACIPSSQGHDRADAPVLMTTNVVEQGR